MDILKRLIFNGKYSEISKKQQPTQNQKIIKIEI